MSYKASAAVWTLELNHVSQHVLHALAFHSCEICGLAWPSVAFLVKETNLGATAIRDALERLRKADLVRVHAYPQGGRARATQYVVLPSLEGLSTAPCGKCQWNLRNPTRHGGYHKDETPKPPAARSVNEKPTAPEGKSLAPVLPTPLAESIGRAMDAAQKAAARAKDEQIR